MQGVLLLDFLNRGQRKTKIQVALFTAVVLAVLLGITFALFDRERRQAERRFQDLFDSRVSDTLNRITDNFDLLGGILRGFQGFYSGSDTVTRSEFRNYVHLWKLNETFLEFLESGLLWPSVVMPTWSKRSPTFVRRDFQSFKLLRAIASAIFIPR
jgi:CHASE1-domain containing sensor protein